jgi:hypothetical protein
LRIVAASDGHVPVLGPEALVGHDAGVSRAHPASLLTCVDEVRPKVGQSSNLNKKVRKVLCCFIHFCSFYLLIDYVGDASFLTKTKQKYLLGELIIIF